MVLLVRIHAQRYLVDAGFGPRGPVKPLPLSECLVSPAIYPGSARLIIENIPPNTDPDQRAWIFQSRGEPDGPWLTNYCFTELEFLPGDFEVMNFNTSKSRTNWFTNKIVCSKFLLDEKGEEVVG